MSRPITPEELESLARVGELDALPDGGPPSFPSPSTPMLSFASTAAGLCLAGSCTPRLSPGGGRRCLRGRGEHGRFIPHRRSGILLVRASAPAPWRPERSAEAPAPGAPIQAGRLAPGRCHHGCSRADTIRRRADPEYPEARAQADALNAAYRSVWRDEATVEAAARANGLTAYELQGEPQAVWLMTHPQPTADGTCYGLRTGEGTATVAVKFLPIDGCEPKQQTVIRGLVAGKTCSPANG